MGSLRYISTPLSRQTKSVYSQSRHDLFDLAMTTEDAVCHDPLSVLLQTLNFFDIGEKKIIAAGFVEAVDLRVHDFCHRYLKTEVHLELRIYHSQGHVIQRTPLRSNFIGQTEPLDASGGMFVMSTLLFHEI